MIDLDAPSPQAPTSAQIRHFLGSNFALSNDPNSTSGTLSSSDAVQLLKNSSAALSEFLQPSPPAGSDPHRYVFLLFSQPDGFDAQTILDSSTMRTSFNLSSFAAKVGLGDPVGGTFILDEGKVTKKVYEETPGQETVDGLQVLKYK
ncbi:PEBP-like protein [Stereum hirsutum FP-91666 SS1]|uniref:PEBP-like protein n=2 Tax=Stereum hirsutum (strain FP-91666) TaxID=721885 RepID=R7RVE6_STEHR|nr:PEBP-like protein [Stereum hirsutum FP-91666 SS1]EIM78966.1 PEBP-like protein [Stereum hirsutum FP-91666 SS1]